MHLILRGADCAEMKFLRREGGAENREIMRSRVGGRERASVLSETSAVRKLLLRILSFIFATT